MEPVNRLNQIIEILRKQSQTEASKTANSRQAGSGTSTADRVGHQKLSLATMKQQVQERIKAFSPADRRNRKKAINVFLESVLVWEFGEEITRDEKYHIMLSKAQETMETHAATQKQFSALLEEIWQRTGNDDLT